jgi:PEP-CTERM/exosortase A-associated glycosyltransferase
MRDGATADEARIVRPEILHAHSPALNAIPALWVGRRFGIPVVYEVRAFWEDAAADHGTSREWGLRYRLTRGLETFALRRADAVTTICEGLRSDMATRGIRPDKVTVIPNAVDTRNSSPAGSRRPAWHRRADAVVLGFIGSFYAYEGLPLLLEALPRILAVDKRVRVLLVGGGPQNADLERLVAARGLGDKVVFAGRVPHSEVERYYDLVDVLVYPRLSMRLTELVTPLKPLEAMAQGGCWWPPMGGTELIRTARPGSCSRRRSGGARRQGPGAARRSTALAADAAGGANLVEAERNLAVRRRYGAASMTTFNPSTNRPRCLCSSCGKKSG